jgi:hypothetical protein
MAHVGPAPTTTRPTSSSLAAVAGFVEWGPIFAGALLASALSFVLLTFGTAIGLSTTSPWPNSGVSATTLAGLAVFWILVQQIGSFMAGGYIAGRMRTRWADTPQDEVNFRDGLHGGLVWALGIVMGAALFMATAGAVARTGAEVAGKTVTASAAAAEAVLDTMLRPAAPAAPADPKQGAAGTAPPAAAHARPAIASEETRALMRRILSTSLATGSLTGESRTYLAQLISQQTGLSQQEAEARINAAVAATREAADKARRTTILAGLVTAVSLVISFAAAWWGALQGGHHRDNAIPARFDYLPRRDFGTPRPRP